MMMKLEDKGQMKLMLPATHDICNSHNGDDIVTYGNTEGSESSREVFLASMLEHNYTTGITSIHASLYKGSFLYLNFFSLLIISY
jgi:hypothetical protein